jgi:hypothetical protein
VVKYLGIPRKLDMQRASTWMKERHDYPVSREQMVERMRELFEDDNASTRRAVALMRYLLRGLPADEPDTAEFPDGLSLRGAPR